MQRIRLNRAFVWRSDIGLIASWDMSASPRSATVSG
jgi:hypothetical protein